MQVKAAIDSLHSFLGPAFKCYIDKSTHGKLVPYKDMIFLMVMLFRMVKFSAIQN